MGQHVLFLLTSLLVKATNVGMFVQFIVLYHKQLEWILWENVTEMGK